MLNSLNGFSENPIRESPMLEKKKQSMTSAWPPVPF